MKNKILIIFLIIISFIFLFPRYILFNPFLIKEPLNSNSLQYRIYWWIFPLGSVSITLDQNGIYNGKKAILIKAIAHTTGLVNKIFDFKAEVYSIVDKKFKLPIIYKEVIFKSGERKENKILYYEQRKHIMKVGGEVYSILPQTYDPLSLYLFLKEKNISPGEKYQLNLNSNQSNYKVEFRVEKELKGRKKIMLIKGISERRKGEKTRHRLKFIIYFSSQTKKCLLLKAFTPLGPVRAKLI